jgi:hypothetical protein
MTIGALATSRTAGPIRLAKQETWYPAALEEVARSAIEGSRLATDTAD